MSRPLADRMTDRSRIFCSGMPVVRIYAQVVGTDRSGCCVPDPGEGQQMLAGIGPDSR